jgi:hypothetical protein
MMRVGFARPAAALQVVRRVHPVGDQHVGTGVVDGFDPLQGGVEGGERIRGVCREPDLSVGEARQGLPPFAGERAGGRDEGVHIRLGPGYLLVQRTGHMDELGDGIVGVAERGRRTGGGREEGIQVHACTHSDGPAGGAAR